MEFVVFCTIVTMAAVGVAVILFAWELVSQLVKWEREGRAERRKRTRKRKGKGKGKGKREKRRVADDWRKEFNRSCRKGAREHRAKVREGRRLERKGRAVAKRNERFRRKFME